ncbi:hypothetical protein HYY70_00210 [Candidatus Woesearchaeota archaeon]|nr:hypothetical protein [Candidatus Woesearchaeota archaeon]
MVHARIDELIEALRNGTERDNRWNEVWQIEMDSKTVEEAIVALLKRYPSSLQRIAEEVVCPFGIQRFEDGYLTVHAIITDMIRTRTRIKGKYIMIYGAVEREGWLQQAYSLSDKPSMVEPHFGREGRGK